MRTTMMVTLLVLLAGVAAADGLEKGDKENSFRFSYSDTDFGVTNGLSLGSIENTEASVTWGWMATRRHEFGFIASYAEQEIDGGDIAPNSTSDGTRLGGFYNFNIPTQGNVTPYIGLVAATLGGDQGDLYDMQYAAEFGVKVYPWEHAGFSVGLGYFELKAAGNLPDADGTTLGAGLLIKY